MGAWVRAGIPHGWVWMTPPSGASATPAGGDGRAGAESAGAGAPAAPARAAALWIPPGAVEMTAAEEADFEDLLVELFGTRAGELASMMEHFAAHHPHDDPHYYLSLWGTHRDHRRHGVGSALLQGCLERIDAEHMPAYLESTNPVNIERYERLGFRALERFGPKDGTVVTTMWRDPRD
jgi:ribosomal protein S18 acetylase RimI-like enzyme